jgi:hypothetical protein
MSSAGKRTRSRPLKFAYSAKEIRKNGGKTFVGYQSPAGNAVIATGRQTTVSESHRYDHVHGHFDGGGPFYTDKVEYGVSPRTVRLEKGGNNAELWYTGPVYCPFPSSAEYTSLGVDSKFVPRSETDFTDLDADGATAISIVSPVNPTSTLSTGFAEGIREGVPSIPGIQTWKRRTGLAKAAGSEFLNVEFGWLPLVGEISKVRDSVRFHRDILNQYHRDEGRNVRREFAFPIERSGGTVVGTGHATFPTEGNAWSTAIGVPLSERVLTLETSVRKWFSGSFTYGLPSQSDSWGRAIGIGSDADKLYGIALTPDVIWELTPWSWAVDWFTNAGDLITNFTNFELAGQIMRYGYMMEEKSTKITASLRTCALKGAETQAGPRSWVEHRSKIRRPANPFGFGLSWEGLSPTQVLIAAAIGITRL